MQGSAWLWVVVAVGVGLMVGCSRPDDTTNLGDPSKQALDSPRSDQQLSALRNRLATTQRDN